VLQQPIKKTSSKVDVTQLHPSEPSRMIWRQVQEDSKGTQKMEARMVLQNLEEDIDTKKKDVD